MRHSLPGPPPKPEKEVWERKWRCQGCARRLRGMRRLFGASMTHPEADSFTPQRTFRRPNLTTILVHQNNIEFGVDLRSNFVLSNKNRYWTWNPNSKRCNLFNLCAVYAIRFGWWELELVRSLVSVKWPFSSNMSSSRTCAELNC